MTNKELNRDILRLYKAIQIDRRNLDMEAYFDRVLTTHKSEFIRLLNAAHDFSVLTKKSILIMMILERSHRFVPLHTFFNGIRPESFGMQSEATLVIDTKTPNLINLVK